jgi:integrase
MKKQKHKVAALTADKHEAQVRGGKAGMHLDGGRRGVRGLYLVVKNKRSANWALRYQLDHRTHWMGLGSALLGDGVTLDQAREKARAARAKLHDRLDPLQERRAERAAAQIAALKRLSFAEASAQFIAQNEASWRNARHRQQWHQTLATYARPINNLPVDQIDTPLVLRVIEPIWQTKTATASRLRGRIESILDWAKARGYRSGDSSNPASWSVIGNVLPNHKTFAKPVHHRALPYADVPAFVAKLRTHKAVAARALEFLILTAARTQETVGARWSEIDWKQRVWTVPPGRMKGGVEHKVLLAPEVIDLLQQLPREGDGDGFVFIGSRAGMSLSPKSLHRVTARLKVDAVPHGFRSSFSDWAHECTQHANHAIEISLAHKVGTDAEQAYRRGPMIEKRRRLMVDWSRFCCTPPKATSDNVVPIAKAR